MTLRPAALARPTLALALLSACAGPPAAPSARGAERALEAAPAGPTRPVVTGAPEARGGAAPATEARPAGASAAESVPPAAQPGPSTVEAPSGPAAGLRGPNPAEVPQGVSAAAAPRGRTAAEPPPDEGAELALDIAARKQDPKSPPSGWCGETAIQEGLLHLGVWAPQSYINRAGRPSHPDLYSNDIPVALRALGIDHVAYAPKAKGFGAYARWVKGALDRGEPVLAGVKILPTEHPEWGLDHFVLVVGYGPKGLLVNTTWGSRRWVDDAGGRGLSFQNAFYAIRLLGPALPRGERPARLAIVDEGPSTLRLRVTCSGLVPGAAYRLERRKAARDPEPAWAEAFTAKSERFERTVEVEADAPARFHCAPR